MRRISIILGKMLRQLEHYRMIYGGRKVHRGFSKDDINVCVGAGPSGKPLRRETTHLGPHNLCRVVNEKVECEAGCAQRGFGSGSEA